MLLDTERNDKKARKLFKFENTWTAVLECKEKIANAWQTKNDNGFSYGIQKKLLACQSAPFKWNKESF